MHVDLSVSAEWDGNPPEGVYLADWQAYVLAGRIWDQLLSELDFETSAKSQGNCDIRARLESPRRDVIPRSHCSPSAYFLHRGPSLIEEGPGAGAGVKGQP